MLSLIERVNLIDVEKAIENKENALDLTEQVDKHTEDSWNNNLIS